MTYAQARTIQALADNGLSRSRAAENSYISRNALSQHVENIYQQTGKDPLNFYDMCELLPVAREILARESG